MKTPNANLPTHRFLRALLKMDVDKTPIWIMRQAGRYLPEYRELRSQAKDFMTFCKTPELACEATMQPLRRFDLDAAILFSDILTIPDAMNLGLHFKPGEGPCFSSPIRDMATIKKLKPPCPETDLGYVCDAVRAIRKSLDNKLPLIGFAGSPWTLATYMVEGQSSKTFNIVRSLIYKDPQALHALLQVLTQSTIQYVNAQIAAGAQAIMLFDSWGGLLTPQTYPEFSLQYMQHILDDITREVDGQRIPTILFSKGAGLWLEQMADTGCDALGIDWMTDLGDARKRVGDRVALQGNLDPAALYGPPERIESLVKDTLNAYGDSPGHVFNLGHGIYPDIPPEHVEHLVNAVHKHSSRE